jgi:hypothetical protein
VAALAQRLAAEAADAARPPSLLAQQAQAGGSQQPSQAQGQEQQEQRCNGAAAQHTQDPEQLDTAHPSSIDADGSGPQAASEPAKAARPDGGGSGPLALPPAALAAAAGAVALAAVAVAATALRKRS